MIRVSYYCPDGVQGTDDDDMPPPHGEEFATEQEAREAVAESIAALVDDADDLLAPGAGYHGESRDDAGRVRLHESDREGCGGFVLHSCEAAQ